MAAKNDYSNIRLYKKKWQFNIGVAIFGIIFIYLVITVLAYLTANHVTPYEVREGTILKDNAYTGIALRQETVVSADSSGYVNYYVAEGSKVGVGDNLYTMSDEKLSLDPVVSENTGQELSAEKQEALILDIQKFSESFDSQRYGSTYALKDEIKNTVQGTSNQSRLDQLNTVMAQGTAGGLTLGQAVKDGIVIYSTDGFEELNTDNITEKALKKDHYVRSDLKNNQKLDAGDAVYKVITDENWSVIVDLPEAAAKEMNSLTDVKVRFLKDDATEWASFSIIKKDKEYFGCLSFSNSMIRYATERYLDVELILQDETGLKIPKSSETEKAFYVVPEEYITQGGDLKEDGVLLKPRKQSEGSTPTFVPVEIYLKEDSKVYLDPNAFDKEPVLVKPDSEETLELSETQNLKGVFSINKGYAVFKQIKILCESDEYYIVEEGNSYGLSNYDRIALDGSKVHENEVVF